MQFYEKYIEAVTGNDARTRSSVDAIMGRMDELLADRPDGRLSGLVVGRVQSGKTRNYVGLALKAAEAAVKRDVDAANNQKAANSVINMINALNPNAGVADKAAVEAARRAYNALTAAQKKLVSAAVLKKLTDAETSVRIAESEPKVTIPKTVKSLKAKAKGKKVTVTWKKDKKTIKKQKIKGYEIRVSQEKDPEKALITKRLGKGKTKWKAKLKKGTWYVWIRYFRGDGVSNWKMKKVKVKK